MRLLDRLFRREDINGGERCPTYLHRWTLFQPRRPRWLWRGFGIYLHKFVGDDWSRDLHDHPKRFISTDEGRAAIGDIEPLPTGPALVTFWMQQFNRLAEREVLRVLVSAYPNVLSAEEVASLTEPPYEPNGGGFRGAVSKLRTLGLIEGRGELRASDDLFGTTRTHK